jgi:hypothetical protein
MASGAGGGTAVFGNGGGEGTCDGRARRGLAAFFGTGATVVRGAGAGARRRGAAGRLLVCRVAAAVRGGAALRPDAAAGLLAAFGRAVLVDVLRRPVAGAAAARRLALAAFEGVARRVERAVFFDLDGAALVRRRPAARVVAAAAVVLAFARRAVLFFAGSAFLLAIVHLPFDRMAVIIVLSNAYRPCQ